MSNLRLPPEILDYIVDFLRDDSRGVVELRTENSLELWKKLFPDPSTSPAHFAKRLHIGCAQAVTAADAEADGWLTGFDHVMYLGVETCESYHGKSAISLVPLHRFSPTIKSLRVSSINIPPSRIFNFILSSPLLEDLTVTGNRTLVGDGDSSDGPPTSVQPANPPMFTGSLGFFLEGGMKTIAGRLLSMPGGIHFRKFTLTWFYAEDLSSVTALVGECSHTLESLGITCAFDAQSGTTSVDLSKATKLKDVTFRIGSPAVEWVTMALRTIAPRHRDLLRISISAQHFSTMFTLGATTLVRKVEEHTLRQWLELDRTLVQLRKSYPIPPRILCPAIPRNEKNARDLMGRLLPETTVGSTINIFYTWC